MPNRGPDWTPIRGQTSAPIDIYIRQEADQAIGRYIDGFYNPVRRHSALDFTSPAQFEKMAAE
jgi:hypothetical protein